VTLASVAQSEAHSPKLSQITGAAEPSRTSGPSSCAPSPSVRRP
jgi:hypothetical protein